MSGCAIGKSYENMTNVYVNGLRTGDMAVVFIVYSVARMDMWIEGYLWIDFISMHQTCMLLFLTNLVTLRHLPITNS